MPWPYYCKDTMTTLELKDCIRDIPDFPKKGIIFKDISTLLKDPQAFKKSIDILTEKYAHQKIDYVVGIESRGFIFGAPLAVNLGAGFIPIRKKGKLPHKTKSITYTLEYGQDTLEIHEDALRPGSRIIVIDDLLATGGTIKAVTDLLKDFRTEIIGVAFLVELNFLKGREKLKNLPVYSIIQYD
jgi:adenine phosphoribosyltransferase